MANPTTQAAALPRTEKHFSVIGILSHPNALVRFLGLAALGFLLLLVTWSIGYYLLPEGAFRRGADAQMARMALDSESSSVLEEWRKLITANLVPVILMIGGSLLIRVNKFSFGYLAALMNVMGYGLFLGTNSFAIAMPERMAPSLAVFSRSGPYEMLALMLIASAVYPWAFFEIKRIFLTNPERVQPPPRVAWHEAALVLVGIGILAAANWIEASMVMVAIH